MQVTAKEIRINALEEQMKVAAREYSGEISRLKTKLFEFEMSVAMDNYDGLPRYLCHVCMYICMYVFMCLFYDF